MIAVGDLVFFVPSTQAASPRSRSFDERCEILCVLESSAHGVEGRLACLLLHNPDGNPWYLGLSAGEIVRPTASCLRRVPDTIVTSRAVSSGSSASGA